MQKVSNAYKVDLQVASTIYSSPSFLMDMTDQLHSTMRLKAIELFAPSGFKLLNEGVELADKVQNYERVVGDMHSSYYSHEVVEAAQASRVEVTAAADIAKLAAWVEDSSPAKRPAPQYGWVQVPPWAVLLPLPPDSPASAIDLSEIGGSVHAASVRRCGPCWISA